MRYWLEKDIRPVDLGREACRRAGITPVSTPTRGGTDGSRLTEMGVPKEAIVSVLQPGDFFGEGCLAGQQAHIATAVGVNPGTVVVVEKKHMFKMLHTHPQLNEQFLRHMLKRNIRIEEELIDHLFNSVEKRLARTLGRLV